MRGWSTAKELRLLQARRLSHGFSDQGAGASDTVLQGQHFGNRPDEAKFHAVVVHGLLGHSRNWRSFCSTLVRQAEVIAKGAWSVFAVDLRNHGKSSQLNFPVPHNYETAAADIFTLYGGGVYGLGRPPDLLIGHSFGGKVVLSYLDCLAKHNAETKDCKLDRQVLAYPQQVWVLDSMLGTAPSGSEPSDVSRVLDQVGRIKQPLASREELYAQMEAAGFSLGLRQWMGSNLTENKQLGGLIWNFRLPEVRRMYKSYQRGSTWPSVMQAVQNQVEIHHVRGEKSDRWSEKAIIRLEELADKKLGFHTHVLPKAGHWVHADNPEGLLRMMEPAMSQISAAADPLTSHRNWQARPL